jgi:hypothetical protein
MPPRRLIDCIIYYFQWRHSRFSSCLLCSLRCCHHSYFQLDFHHSATACLANTDTAVANRRTRQTVTIAPTSTSADRLSSADAADANIGTQMPSHSVSNKNQPSRTPRPYMADLPVGIHPLLMNVPETELGDCP